MQSKLNDKMKKLQTYKMFEGEDTKYVELNDVLQTLNDYKLSLKEVRQAADVYGYMAVKRNYNKLIPCLCGCNKRRRVIKDGKYYIECKECERYVVGDNVNQAVEKWNKTMIPEKRTKSEEHRKHLSESAKAYWARKKEEENEPESRETI